MAKGYYRCECGKEFDNPQKFNGHKNGCEIHFISIGRPNALRERIEKRTTTIRLKINSPQYLAEKESKKEKERIQWVEERHKCEKCGKVMDEKFGCGRFCSRSCANSHIVTEEHRNKTSQTIKNKCASGEIKSNRRKKVLPPHPCCICGNLIFGKRKTCSEECLRKRQSQSVTKSIIEHDGCLNAGSSTTYRQGFYDGTHFDSSYELAFYVYLKELGVPICRNKNSFDYFYNGSWHKYYPDFIVNGFYIEIKNFETECVIAKANSIPKCVKYRLLYRDDIKNCINYCKKKYGFRYWEVLFDYKMA